MDTEQQISDEFNTAFARWQDSVPEARQYCQSLGFGTTGLHNMLFHFFKAGYDFSRRWFSKGKHWVGGDYMVIVNTDKEKGSRIANIYTEYPDAMLLLLDLLNQNYAYEYRSGSMDYTSISRSQLEGKVNDKQSD